MMTRTTLLCAAFAAILVFGSTAWAGPGGRGNDPYVWVHAGNYRTLEEDLPLTEEHGEDWTWYPGCPVIGSAYAYGDIATSQYGTAKAKCSLNYHDPFGIETLSIGADVETWKPFVITSATLPAGTPITARVGISYTGSLEVLEKMAGKTSEAYASFEVTLYDKHEAELGVLDGTATVVGDASNVYTTTITGDWVGKLTQSGTAFNLDYADVITFPAVVGDKYWLYFDLATSCWSSEGSNLGWDNSKTYASANFADTATYTLSSTADVNFVTVPEPATLALLAAGGLGLLRRRAR